jgi:DNA-binding NarL/FixJ family response regulator
VLVDRLAIHSETMQRMAAANQRSVEDFLRSESAWGRNDRSPGATSRGQGRSLTRSLTPREREILELMAGGSSNDQIAARLFITPGTVKTHVKHVLRKLNATNRAQAVSMFLQPEAATGP